MTGRAFDAEQPMRVALGGFGNVGRELAKRLCAGAIPEARLSAVSARRLARARKAAAELEPAPLVVAARQLPEHADVIVECATFETFPAIARTALEAQKTLVTVSVGALAEHPEIIALARETGGTIRIASGALAGLDAIRAAAEGTIHSLILESRQRPESLAREPYILDRGFDLSGPPREPVKVFEGTAGEAAAAFPRHFNVAVTLSLVGIGFERTRIRVWADAGIAGTVHHVEVEADDISLSMTSRNTPSPDNPRTSRSVAPSILAALRSLVAPVQIGS